MKPTPRQRDRRSSIPCPIPRGLAVGGSGNRNKKKFGKKMIKTKTIKRISTLLLAFSLSLNFWPKEEAEAVGFSLRLNEVAPSESSSLDWIELYVSSAEDFSNYKIKERTTSIYTFPASFHPSAGDFVVLHINQTGVDEDDIAGKGSNGIWDFYSSDSGLVGTDNVIILEDSSGQIKDALCFADYDSTWASTQETAFNNAVNAGQWTGNSSDGGAANNSDCFDWQTGGAGKSIGRDKSSSDTDASGLAKNDWSLYENQTPGQVNFEEDPTENPNGSFSDQVVISEIYPDPLGSDENGEFVELRNLSAEAVDLKDWQIQDKSTTYKIKSTDFSSTVIQGGGFFVIYRSQSAIALNNTGGEAVSLLSPDGQIKSSISYSVTAPEGQSFALFSSGWSWTQTPTPGEDNFFSESPSPNQSPKAIAGDNKKIYLGEKVTFDGSDSYDPDNDPLSYFWDFGDGDKAEGMSVIHAYKKAKRYSAKLRVEDGRGGSDEDVFSVYVSKKKTKKKKAEKKEVNKPKGPFSRHLIISEILPDPEGQDSGDGGVTSGEWIEIKNKGKTAVDLSFWQIDDEEGGSRPFTIEDKVIRPGRYLVFYYPQTKIMLNNSSDEARLLDPDGKVAFKIAYSGAEEGLVFALNEKTDKFSWSEKSTPGATNQIIDVKEDATSSGKKSSRESTSNFGARSDDDSDVEKISFKTISIKEAREEERYTKVKIKGRVLVEPGLLGSKIFYLQDESGGIQIYFSKEDFPDLTLGDLISVSGKISEAAGEKKINVAEKEDIALLSHGSPPLAKSKKTGEVNEEVEGQLISVQAEMIRRIGQTYYLDDGSGKIRFYIKKETGIKKEIAKGEKVKITGVVSQTTSGYRILPRYQNDVLVGEEEIRAAGISENDLDKTEGDALPEVGNNIFVILLLALSLTFAFFLPRALYLFQKH